MDEFKFGLVNRLLRVTIFHERELNRIVNWTIYQILNPDFKLSLSFCTFFRVVGVFYDS